MTTEEGTKERKIRRSVEEYERRLRAMLGDAAVGDGASPSEADDQISLEGRIGADLLKVFTDSVLGLQSGKSMARWLSVYSATMYGSRMKLVEHELKMLQATHGAIASRVEKEQRAFTTEELTAITAVAGRIIETKVGGFDACVQRSIDLLHEMRSHWKDLVGAASYLDNGVALALAPLFARELFAAQSFAGALDTDTEAADDEADEGNEGAEEAAEGAPENADCECHTAAFSVDEIPTMIATAPESIREKMHEILGSLANKINEGLSRAKTDVAENRPKDDAPPPSAG